MIAFNSAGILKALGIGAGIFAFVQGLKNLVPSLFDKVPNLARWIAGLTALAAALVPCFLSGAGADLNCIADAILAFLTAVGLYHSVAQAGGSVQPPLPPAPSAK